MKHIFRNFLPYKGTVLMILLLLAVQAACDLALPGYTSDLIDTGIQSSGVEHIMPARVSPEEYAAAQLFMDEGEKKDWQAAYRSAGDFYELKTEDRAELDRLDGELLLPVVMTYQLGHMTEDSFRRFTGMDLDQFRAAAGMELRTFKARDENGREREYVDARQALAVLMASGKVSAEALASTRRTMEAQVDAVGSRTLEAMGRAYAAECEEGAGIDAENRQMSYLWRTGAVMLAIAAVMLAVAIANSYLASRVGASVGRDLRSRVFRNVIGFSNAEMEAFSTASLITRSTNDVQQIQMVSVMVLRLVLYAPIMGIGGVYKVWRTGAGMGWVIGLAVLVIMAMLGLLLAVAMPKFRMMQVLVDRINLVAREILTGLSVIRAFGREETERSRFDRVNSDLRRNQLFTNRVMTFMMPGMMLVMNGLVVLITWVAAHRIDAGVLQVGAMTAFITYAMQIVLSFLMISAMSIILPRAGVAADRIQEVIDSRSSIEEPEDPRALPEAGGRVEFRDVSFRYPGAENEVLSHVSFTAEPGTTTAVIGATGSGKSTLINLIPRFYDVTGGSIMVDGVDVRDAGLHELRDRIGLVPQKGVLFSGTVASNIAFADSSLSDERIREAAETAQAADFIEAKEQKYAEPISQGGSNVSGGQKQRIAIARAIASNAELYIFDDSFSALDMKTDAALRRALAEKVKDKTVIIVAQRISTIMDADNILVLDEGRIAGSGRHGELLKSCEVYRQIAGSQLSERELGLGEAHEGREA